jgi:hypothetical protein
LSRDVLSKQQPWIFIFQGAHLRGHVMGLTLSRKKGKKLVLSVVEEEKVIKYIMGITELKIKVAEATQMRKSPFKEGIPGPGWLRWFRKRHSEIHSVLHKAWMQGGQRNCVPSRLQVFMKT